MKILIVHNYYKETGGEDVVVSLERKLLEDGGNEVFTYFRSNAEIKGISSTIKTLMDLPYSGTSRREFEEILRSVKPDVVHMHNLFMVISFSILDACWEHNIPVVMTLHNYRLLSPNAMFFHAGKIDTRSLQGSAYRCSWHRCYRNSFLLTTLVARMIEYHRKRNTWNTRIARFIVPTEFAKQKFVEGGIHENRLVVKPNFLPDEHERVGQANRENVYLFVGRISEEKGIRFLLEAWRGVDKKLRIIGEGPLKSLILKETKRNPNLEYAGFVQRAEIPEILSKAKALIFPSVWFEVFPMVILESLNAGTPVICSRTGGLPEIVVDRYNGLLFDPGDVDSFKKAISLFEKDPELRQQLSRNAKSSAEKYLPGKNLELLIEIYKQAIAELSQVPRS